MMAYNPKCSALEKKKKKVIGNNTKYSSNNLVQLKKKYS